jgi:hypothetical protein
MLLASNQNKGLFPPGVRIYFVGSAANPQDASRRMAAIRGLPANLFACGELDSHPAAGETGANGLQLNDKLSIIKEL